MFRRPSQRYEERLLPFHANWNLGESVHCLLFVLLYAVLANVPYWAASRWLGLLPLGWFCLEYAAVGLLALFAPRILTTVVLLLVIAADLLSGISKTYSLAPSECVANLGALREFPGSRLLVVAGVGILVLVVVALAMSLPATRILRRHRFCAAGCLLLFVAVSVSADCVYVVRETGQLPSRFGVAKPADSRRVGYFSKRWMSRYPIIRLVHSEKSFASLNATSVPVGDDLFIRNASGVAIRALRLGSSKSSNESPNVVIVLVESWGIENDSQVRNSLIHSYLQPDLQARYEVLQGEVPFYGATVAGEARELCGSRMGTQILTVSANASQGCLPDRFDSLGYHSVALHGMSGNMFHRSTWYGNIGFQEQWFRDQFRREGLPDCAGAFIGTCDAAIADWIGRRLDSKDANPDFVYWVTLNSHLPVPSMLARGASCSLVPLLGEEPALCSWYQLVANVHDSVSRLAMSKLGRPTVFVIVGDHVPPFTNPVLRSQFSNDEVPYVVLLPRQDRRISIHAANDPMMGLRPRSRSMVQSAATPR
jgi:hypothetical protein